MTRIGFLGVGTISDAVVRAMCARPGMTDLILLSPRSAERSRALAQEFAQCRVMESNQEVIDASDIVVLGMRPQQVDDALASLEFGPDQVIASFIAGTPPSGIAPLVAPATTICQLIPLPPITLHRGPLVVCPGVPEVLAAFDGLGDLIVLDDESRIRVLSCASAIMSTYFELQNRVIDWITDHGIDEAIASRYIRSELDGLAAVGQVTPDSRRGDLPGEFQTKGGLNERVRAGLLDRGWFDALPGELTEIYDNAVLRTPGRQ
ncbi:MAG: NAD(P)-binding domain-containing protein [Actinomycetota bacterium]